MPQKSPLVDAVNSQDLPVLTRALAKYRGPIPARIVVRAGQLGWTAGLALLKNAGADLNGMYRNYRVLHALIQEETHADGLSTPERVRCMEWLLAHGADPELPGAWPSARALVIAACWGEVSYVRTLKKAGAEINIFTAAALGDAARVNILLKQDPGLSTARDYKRLTALQCCGGSKLGSKNAKIAAGLCECAKALVDAGADVNAKTKTWANEVDVAYFVIRSGQKEMLMWLLDRGLDATAAVASAAWASREDILDLLIARGAMLNEAFDRTKPVLNELIRWGQFTQARMLLARGASPNISDDRGWTAVHQAVSRGNVKMLQDLMAKGGDATREDRTGSVPSDLARGPKRAELLRALARVSVV